MDYINKEANVTTDWNGCKPLKKEYNLMQIPSADGNNFPDIHFIL